MNEKTTGINADKLLLLSKSLESLKEKDLQQ